MSQDDLLRDKACIVGIGRSAYGKRGSLEHEGTLRLALQAIHDACRDAGVDPNEIDGFSSYSDDAAHPSMLQMALGTPRVRYAAMVWGGGVRMIARARTLDRLRARRSRNAYCRLCMTCSLAARRDRLLLP